MNANDQIKCRCGTVFTSRNENPDAPAYLCGLCQECLDGHEAIEAAKEAQRAKEREEWTARNKIEVAASVAEATPELFRRTDITHPKFNAAAWAKIEKHKLSEETPWIGFIGMTGRCKSRMAYLYATKEVDRLTGTWKATFAFVSSYEIGDAVTRQYGDFEAKDKARSFLDKLRNVDVLLIDDLGKGRLTPAVASELFALMPNAPSPNTRCIGTMGTCLRVESQYARYPQHRPAPQFFIRRSYRPAATVRRRGRTPGDVT